ncbi:MAG: 1-(5-phosphoribosyl)-5-((5-phosphoribosylamino)methylideneamino)imidazole-4-carboxamide isomerase, partial [Clostridiales bacterium]|nr:1-(5-phosphoribosyl)-5-((5-phosphoribosylamino)methylideneamino)imidazole-4-carboxamide isomerase [Clostridiales bacterium]
RGPLASREAIKNILKVITIPLQLGGGIRNEKSIYDMLELGVSRIILGTSALQDKAFTKLMIQKYKGKIAVSIDAKNGYAAVNGWTEVSEIRAIDLANELAGYGLETLIYTDIAKDGMLAGPNFKELDDMNKGVPIDIIASGGISRVNDIEKLMQMQLYGAIIGKALYTGAISLNDISGKMEE